MSDERRGGPVVLVTGATDGIGRETALELTRRGARVLVHGRNEARLAETHAALVKLGGAPLDPIRADLSRLDDVRAMALGLERRGVGLDVLLNNAGIYATERQTSADGFELTFAVNHLAPFLLTHLLLASPVAPRRVVNVSSVAHNRGRIDLDDLGFDRRGFDGYATYAASKLANVLFTVELARRVASRKITVNALHPGVVSTKLLTEGFGMRGGDSLAEGSATSVRLALDEDLAGVTGGYYSGGKPAPTSAAAKDLDLARRFYEKSATLTGVAPLPG